MPKRDDLTIYLRAEDKTKKAFSTVSKNIDKLKKAGAGLAKGFAAITASVGLVGAALVKTFTSNAPYIDALGKTADKLGLATEQLQAYRDAAEFAGIGNASLDTSLQRFIRRLGEAANGTGATAKEFQRLGIDAAALNAQGPAQAFETILDKIKAVENQTERVRLAFAFFGKEGVDLVRLTTDAIEKSRMQMDELGLSISRVDAARVEMANDAIKRLGDIADGVGRRITANLSGAVTVLTNRLVGAASKFLGMRDAGTNTSETILIAIGKVVDMFRRVQTGLDIIRIGFTKLNIKVLEFSRNITTAVSDKVLGGLARFDNDIGMFAQSMLDAGTGTGAFSEKITKLYGELETLNNGVRERLEQGSFTDSLLSDLAAVDAEAEAIAANLRSIQTVNSALTSGADGTTTSTDPVTKTAEAYKVTSEQLKLFTADTDAARASSEAMRSVITSSISALDSLSAAYANPRKQARTFVAIQEILATVSAYSAATQALADASAVTPFQKFAAYASVLARGLAGLAAIKKAGKRLGAGGASGSATAADTTTSSATSTAASIANQPNNQAQTRAAPNVTLNLSGGGRYSSDEVENIFEQMKRQGLIGNVTVN